MDDLELARRTDALRALARGLLEDPHDAEDVVQEAWAASLEARPRDLFAWLRGATRRLAARTLRSRARRRRRERAAARPEADAAAEADVLQALAAELARLEDPYRTVLVLRYYRDRRPPEIAADLRVPVATVKTRLRRGLAILRARLSRERRGWALVLAPLAARPLPLGLVLGVVGTLSVATLLFVGSRDRSAPGTARATEATAPARADTPATADVVEEPQRPRAEVLVEGPDGPVADAEVTIAPLDRWWETISARTDVRGAAAFDVPEGEHEVRAEAKGLVRGGAFVRAPGTTRVRLRAGCRLRLRLNPWPDPAWKQFRWSAQGEIHVARELAFDAAEIDTGTWPAGVVSIGWVPAGGGVSRCIRIALPGSGEVVHEIAPPSAGATEIEVTDAETGAVVHEWTASLAGLALPREPGARSGTYRLPARDGLVRIEAQGYARAFVGLPREGEARVALRRGAALRVSFAPGARPREVRVFYNSPAGGTSSRGISVGPGTAPPAGEELNLTDLGWETEYLARTITEADAWTAAGLPPEARVDIVGLDDQGLFAFRQVETGLPGSEATVDVAWTPTVRHRFVVRDRGGRPVPGAEIRILVALGRDAYLGSIRTDADGRGSARGFRTDRAYAVQLVHRGGAERRGLALQGPDGETELVAEEQERVRRRVLVLDDAGRPIPGARVQFGAREGFGSFAISGEDGIAVGKLRPGDELYLVGVSLEPGGGAVLETMMKPPADDPIVYRGDIGKVRVIMEIEGEGLVDARLRGGRRDLDLKVHVHGRGTAAFQLRVEPGEYRVEATLDGRTVERALVVRKGEPAVVPLRFDR